MKSTIIKEIRIGLIVARIRRGKSRDGVRYSTTLVRLYRNGDHWKESSRLGRDDIPLVRLVLDQAHTWILQQVSNRGKSRAS